MTERLPRPEDCRTREERLAYLRTCPAEELEIGAAFMGLTLMERLELSLARLEHEEEDDE